MMATESKYIPSGSFINVTPHYYRPPKYETDEAILEIGEYLRNIPPDVEQWGFPVICHYDLIFDALVKDGLSPDAVAWAIHDLLNPPLSKLNDDGQVSIVAFSAFFEWWEQWRTE